MWKRALSCFFSVFSGNVSLEQFLEQVNLLPDDTLDELFSFLIVPKDINEEAHKAFSRTSHHSADNVIPQVKENNKAMVSLMMMMMMMNKM